MNLQAMNFFLSEENIKKHLEHLRTARLKFSILEKSIPEIAGRSIGDIFRMKLKSDIKNEALGLLWYISSHEIFFDSFTDRPLKSEGIKKYYSSNKKFLYELFVEAKNKDHGFLYIRNNKKRQPEFVFRSEFSEDFIKNKPVLSIDLYEHTYFSDYGFSKEKFLRNALTYLNISTL